MFELKGKVVAIGNVQAFKSGFVKREIIVDTAPANSKYQNPVKFTFTKDHVNDINNVNVGDEATIKFVVNGRKWEGGKGVQYFVDLAGFGIAVAGTKTVNSTPAPATPDNSISDTVADDMPF